MADWIFARRRVAAPKSRQRVRVTASVPLGPRNPWNAHGTWGQYAEVWVASNCIWIRWSSRATPPFEPSVCVVSEPGVADPHLIIDARGAITIVYTLSGAVYLTTSTDDAETWSTPEVSFASGSRPTIARGNDGSAMIGARVAGKLSIRYRAPGDASWGTAFVAKDDAAADIAIADDTFNITAGDEGPARWELHVIIDGETATSSWFCSDEGDASTGTTWTRFT